MITVLVNVLNFSFIHFLLGLGDKSMWLQVEKFVAGV